MMVRRGIMLLLLCASLAARCQLPDSGRLSLPVTMDSFIISSGFDVNAFIARVRTDTTFYKAFKSMHLLPYSAENDIRVLDKNGALQASLYSHTRQSRNGNCRVTTVTDEKTTGDFYTADGDYNYYTAKLYAHLFFALQPRCNEQDIVAGTEVVKGSGQLEKSEYEMKQLIFNPGARVSGAPFVGKLAAVFDEGERYKYDFHISRETLDGVECFKFRISPLPDYIHKVLYNDLTTWLRTDDYTIIARDYSLSYSTWVYDFDVKMKVRTAQVGGKLCPTSISYDGNWHIVTRKRERVKFTAVMTY